MKITFFETTLEQEQYLKARLKKHSLRFFRTKIDSKSLKLVKDTEVLGVFIGSTVDAEVLKVLPKLKLIVTMSTGYDHIDLIACKKRKIVVANVPFYGENTVAEHAFALLLSISRKIHQSYLRTSHGNFSNDGLQGFDLKGKTIGVIGTGHIGRHVIRMAKGFDMNILAFDMYPDKAWAKKQGISYVTLSTLLKKSDIVTLHVPYMKATHHLLNKKNIALMKKGAVLINTARGGLVDTVAMVKALQQGKLQALGLDVFEGEQQIKEEAQLLTKDFTREDLIINIENHVLMHSDKVVLTPHNSFNSKEALERILAATVENIEQFIGKKKVNNQVK
jgi:D-lactate dehydrogenase